MRGRAQVCSEHSSAHSGRLRSGCVALFIWVVTRAGAPLSSALRYELRVRTSPTPIPVSDTLPHSSKAVRYKLGASAYSITSSARPSIESPPPRPAPLRRRLKSYLPSSRSGRGVPCCQMSSRRERFSAPCATIFALRASDFVISLKVHVEPHVLSQERAVPPLERYGLIPARREAAAESR